MIVRLSVLTLSALHSETLEQERQTRLTVIASLQVRQSATAQIRTGHGRGLRVDQFLWLCSCESVSICDDFASDLS